MKMFMNLWEKKVFQSRQQWKSEEELWTPLLQGCTAYAYWNDTVKLAFSEYSPKNKIPIEMCLSLVFPPYLFASLMAFSPKFLASNSSPKPTPLGLVPYRGALAPSLWAKWNFVENPRNSGSPTEAEEGLIPRSETSAFRFRFPCLKGSGLMGWTTSESRK